MSDESTTVGTESEEREPEELDAGSTRTSATDLGDVTVHRLPEGLQRLVQTVGFEGDAVDYYRFELSESREVRMALQARSGEVELYLEDAVGEVLSRSMAFASYELVVRTLPAGTYYLRVLPAGTGGSEYEFKYGVFPADDAWRPWGDEPRLAERLGMPSFEESEYGFALAEHADGSLERVSLGVVTATDTNGDALHYRLVGGNESGRFAIDAETGELFYAGPGEDYEGGAGSHELTVRAGDGTHTVDATVTVTVTDVPEAPAFTQASYAFALAENVDGSEARVALGTVSATDPDGDTLSYALVGGNESGRFAIDAESGELFYAGPGEDYESGAGPHELTVRVSDGTHTDEATQTVDATVTVTVTDVPEAPAFTQASYGFALAEHTDGSEAQVSLGTVSATDPDGDALRYTVVGGNESGRFAIDEASGELSYVGAGEDYESGAGPFELTVRASDGQLTAETAVTVTVTDVPGDSEEEDGDLPADRTTSAVVRVDEGPVRGTIESASDWDWFAVDLFGGGRAYRIDLRGHSTGDGTLIDPVLMGVYDYSTERRLLPGTADNEGGTGHNSRAEFVAPHDGRYYIWVAGNGSERSGTGTYELEVREVPALAFATSHHAFELPENANGSETRIPLGTVMATNPEGDSPRYRLVGGNETGLFAIDASSGELYYVGTGEDYEGGVASHRLTVHASDGTRTADTTVTVTVTDAPEAPAFAVTSHDFVLAENTDGSETGFLLGRVTATDPDGDTVRYALVGDDDVGAFRIDETSGELRYVGTGEDYESGAGPHELTVRASDGQLTAETAVTVTVTDVPEAPSFGGTSYGFALSENIDGSTDRVLLGAVTATDSDGDAPSYAIVDGNESGRFDIDASSGELYYVGSGEDYESFPGPYELTVRASDGTHATDTAVPVAVIDVPGASEPDDADLPAGRDTSGLVIVDENIVSGALSSQVDRDWFSVTLAPGRTYFFILDNDSPNSGVTPVIRGLRDANGDLLPGVERGSDFVRYTTDAAAEAATYFIEIGSQYGSGAATGRAPGVGNRGFGVLSKGLAILGAETDNVGESDEATRYQLSVRDVTVPAGTEDDYAEDTSTTGVVAEGSPLMGEVQFRCDADWIRVDLKGGQLYRFNMKGAETGDGTLRDPYIYGIFDSNGNRIGGISGDYDGTSRNAEVEFMPGRDGTYYVGCLPKYAHDRGTYTLSVKNITDLDTLTHDTDTTGRVEVNGSVESTIDHDGDVDWFQVSLEAGKVYFVEVIGDGRRNGFSPDVGQIYDSNGESLGIWAHKYLNTKKFQATETGIHYVAIDAYTRRYSLETGGNPKKGTYTLHVNEVPNTDEHPASIETEGVVEVGGSTRGRLDFSNDQDWFKVSLEAGVSYHIVQVYQEPYLSYKAVRLYGVYDSEGNRMQEDPTLDFDVPDYGPNSSSIFFRPEEAGDYFVSAGFYYRGSGDYTLSVEDLRDDFTADTNTVGEVEVGGSVIGKAERHYDRDWFAVSLEAGKTYRFDLVGAPADIGALPDPFLPGIYDADGDPIHGTLDDDSGVGNSSRTYFKAPDDATYYVAAASGNKKRGAYELSVIELVDDYADGTDTTGRVEIGDPAEGEAALADRDWFAVTLQAGKTYRFDVEGAPTGAGTMPDPYLYGVHDAGGRRVIGTANDDSGIGANSRLYFSPSANGDYYVVVGASGNEGGGTYRVSVTEPMDDHPAGTETTGTVAVGGTENGDIEFPRDRDWYAVTLVAGKTYRIDLEGWSTGAGTLYDPYLRGVYDGEGVLIGGTTNDNSGRFLNSRVWFTSSEAGTYYVAAGANHTHTGTYTLSVTEFPDDFTAGTGTTGTVTVGGTAKGNIELAGDRDWFAVTLTADTLYRIDLEGSGTGAGTLNDPYLRGVYDGEGVLIGGTTNDDGGVGYNSRVWFTPSEAGTYYVAAGAVLEGTGTYTLSVDEVM